MINLSQLQYVKEADQNELYLWAKLIGAQSREEYHMIAKHNEYLAEAVAQTEAFNRDSAQREEALRRQMAVMDEVTRRESAYKSGREDGEKFGRSILKLIDCLTKDNEIDKISEITHNAELRN